MFLTKKIKRSIKNVNPINRTNSENIPEEKINLNSDKVYQNSLWQTQVWIYIFKKIFQSLKFNGGRIPQSRFNQS